MPLSADPPLSARLQVVAVVRGGGTPHRAALLSADGLAALVEDIARRAGLGPVHIAIPTPSLPTPSPTNDDDDDDYEVDDLHTVGIDQLERLIDAVRRLRADTSSGRLVLRPRTHSVPPPGERLNAVVRRAVDARRDCPAAAAA